MAGFRPWFESWFSALVLVFLAWFGFGFAVFFVLGVAGEVLLGRTLDSSGVGGLI